MPKRKDYSLDSIGKRLSGVGLTKHERMLAADDHQRVNWIRSQVSALHPESLIDIGASDGAIASLLAPESRIVYAIERHPLQVPAPNVWWYRGEAVEALKTLGERCDVALCCEVLEHLDARHGAAVLEAVGEVTDHLLITVPNRHSKSFDKSGRSRWDWPDHKRDFSAASLRQWLEDLGWDVPAGVQPIVGTLNDGIWLGAVCVRA